MSYVLLGKLLNFSDSCFHFKIGEVIFYLIRLWEKLKELLTHVEAPKLAGNKRQFFLLLGTRRPTPSLRLCLPLVHFCPGGGDR